MRIRILPRLSVVVLTLLVALSCGNNRQPKAYSYTSEMTGNDSLLIKMGQWDLMKYHSEKLGIDINYPSFLYHQNLPSENSQEVFMYEDVSISVIVDSLSGIGYSAGQQMIGMGADLVEATDTYSILTGQDEDLEYYGKVIEDDTVRIITVMLRYNPEHSEAMEAMREWVNQFDGR